MYRFFGLFRSWWQHKASLVISVGVTALGLSVYLVTFVGERPAPLLESIERIELNTLDTRFGYRGSSHTRRDPRIVIVDIDQHSQEILGRWPFSRSHFARMLDVLREDGARVVAFDITFGKPDETSEPIRALRAEIRAWQKQGLPLDPRLATKFAALEAKYNSDEQFAHSIESFGPVVLGNFFLYSQADLAGLDDTTLDRYANLLAFFSFPQVRPVRPKPASRIF